MPAGNTLQLKALANIDSLRAHGHAFTAVDATTTTQDILLVGTTDPEPRFAALWIVPDRQRVNVRQHPLNAGIRAQIIAELFPKPCQIKVQQPRKHHHHRVADRSRLQGPQSEGRCEIRHQCHRQHHAHQHKQRPLQPLFPNLCPVPGPLIQLAACTPVTFNRHLDTANQLFQKHRLRAQIATPDAAGQRGK